MRFLPGWKSRGFRCLRQTSGPICAAVGAAPCSPGEMEWTTPVSYTHLLYRLMEKLNWFFHQEMHYLDRETAEKTARECYPEIRDFTYDILWNDLPKEIQKQLMDEEESL